MHSCGPSTVESHIHARYHNKTSHGFYPTGTLIDWMLLMKYFQSLHVTQFHKLFLKQIHYNLFKLLYARSCLPYMLYYSNWPINFVYLSSYTFQNRVFDLFFFLYKILLPVILCAEINLYAPFFPWL